MYTVQRTMHNGTALDTTIKYVVLWCDFFQEMLAAALEMEGRMPGWRSGLIPFAKDVDDNFLVSRTG